MDRAGIEQFNGDRCLCHPSRRPQNTGSGGRSALELPEESNAFAYEVLREYGNMSSATILFVLDKLSCISTVTRRDQQSVKFCLWPGLTVEGMVLKTQLA
jgi:predicted naringenin-chalcone synthase